MQERIHLGNLKRLIESLPLEASAVTTAAPHLATLTGPQFAALLKELASDNHAYRCAFGAPSDLLCRCACVIISLHRSSYSTGRPDVALQCGGGRR